MQKLHEGAQILVSTPAGDAQSCPNQGNSPHFHDWHEDCFLNLVTQADMWSFPMISDLKKSIVQNATMKLVATSSEFKRRVGLSPVTLPSGATNATLAIAQTAASLQQR
jgi:hypothetical protein